MLSDHEGPSLSSSGREADMFCLSPSWEGDIKQNRERCASINLQGKEALDASEEISLMGLQAGTFSFFIQIFARAFQFHAPPGQHL